MSDRSVLPLLLQGFDDAWNRLAARLDGLTDDEYHWEPVGSMWTVRRAADGTWAADWDDVDRDPARVTTIAWRTWHLASDCLADYLSRSPAGRPLEVTGEQWHGDAASALRDLTRAAAAFRAAMTGFGEDGIWQPLGPAWERFADAPWAALLVHATDELAHHGAEIALLRDLYRWR
jgi:DinB superfamily